MASAALTQRYLSMFVKSHHLHVSSVSWNDEIQTCFNHGDEKTR